MKLVITDAATLTGDGITEDALDVFSKYADVTAYDLTTRDQLVERLQDTELVLCNKTVFTPSIFAQCPKLEYIGVCATGYNNIDTHSAITHDVTVCNAGVYATDAVAQHTFGLILHFYNQVAAYHEAVQNGAWKQSTTFSPILFPTQELTGKTLAVIGYGSRHCRCI
jgi:glycerate dehydrogenase